MEILKLLPKQNKNCINITKIPLLKQRRMRRRRIRRRGEGEDRGGRGEEEGEEGKLYGSSGGEK